MGGMRTCTGCDLRKPESEFPTRADRAGQVLTRCRSCVAAAMRAKRQARRTPCTDCGVPSQGLRCRYCQSRAAQALATAARADALRLDPAVWALRRAKAGTCRWLREETRRRCPICLKRVRGKGAKYCSYLCFATTQVPQGRRQSIKPRLRARVIARDGYVCQICGEKTSLVHDPADDLSPEIDHIIPVRDGGKNLMENLRVAHRVCNRNRNAVLWSV